MRSCDFSGRRFTVGILLSQAHPGRLSALSEWRVTCSELWRGHPGRCTIPRLCVLALSVKVFRFRFSSAGRCLLYKGRMRVSIDQALHLVIFLRCKSLLKPAKPPIDSLHRHLCLFGDCGAGRSTLSDIEPVTTFSDDTNWSSINTGSLVVPVGMMLVSNRSNRRDRLLLIIFVVSVIRPVISGPPIPEQLRRRMFPPRRTPPVSTRGLAPRHEPRFPVSASRHRKHAPARLGQPGRSRSHLSGIGTSRASEFGFVYCAFLTWLPSSLDGRSILESMISSWMRPEAPSKRLNSLPLVLHPRPFGGGNGEGSECNTPPIGPL
jgi:hypothetical protein